MPESKHLEKRNAPAPPLRETYRSVKPRDRFQFALSILREHVVAARLAGSDAVTELNDAITPSWRLPVLLIKRYTDTDPEDVALVREHGKKYARLLDPPGLTFILWPQSEHFEVDGILGDIQDGLPGDYLGLNPANYLMVVSAHSVKHHYKEVL